MNKFLPLLLCLLLSIFTLPRATKPRQTNIPSGKTTHKEPSRQEADGKMLFDDANTDEHRDDNDSTEVPSSADGENANNDGNDDASGDQNAGDDGTADDDGSDDVGGGESQ